MLLNDILRSTCSRPGIMLPNWDSQCILQSRTLPQTSAGGYVPEMGRLKAPGRLHGNGSRRWGIWRCELRQELSWGAKISIQAKYRGGIWLLDHHTPGCDSKWRQTESWECVESYPEHRLRSCWAALPSRNPLCKKRKRLPWLKKPWNMSSAISPGPHAWRGDWKERGQALLGQQSPQITRKECGSQWGLTLPNHLVRLSKGAGHNRRATSGREHPHDVYDKLC